MTGKTLCESSLQLSTKTADKVLRHYAWVASIIEPDSDDADRSPAITISASPTACLLRGYGRVGTQNDRFSEAVILSTGTSTPAQWTCRRRCRDRAESAAAPTRGSRASSSPIPPTPTGRLRWARPPAVWPPLAIRPPAPACAIGKKKRSEVALGACPGGASHAHAKGAARVMGR